jgi:hypothetical protein
MCMKRISDILLAVSLSLYLPGCGEKNNFRLSPEDLYNSGELQVITSWFNDKHQTISVLYGNEQAMQATDSIHNAGEQYTLVTWHQQGNPLWFGGQINGRIARVEQVNITASAQGNTETKYSVPYQERADSIPNIAWEEKRITYILTRRKVSHP